MFADNTDFQCPVAKFSKVEHILQTSHTWLLGELSKNNVKQSFPTAKTVKIQIKVSQLFHDMIQVNDFEKIPSKNLTAAIVM